MKVSADVLDVLASAEVDGTHLRITRQLDRNLYTATNKVLEAAGGKWNRKAKAHIFAADPRAALAAVQDTGTVTTAQDVGFFPTPAPVAARLLELAELTPGMEVLEPSAGRGDLVRPLVAAGALVDAVELDERHRPTLALIDPACREPGRLRRADIGDFLAVTPRADYDRVVMNPPFAKQADIDHVRHALRFLRPGGLLVAVMAAGDTFRHDRKAAGFRADLQAAGGRLEELPADAFRESGTGVRTVIAVFPAPVRATSSCPLAGDLVREKRTNLVGTVAAATLPAHVVVRWTDGTTREVATDTVEPFTPPAPFVYGQAVKVVSRRGQSTGHCHHGELGRVTEVQGFPRGIVAGDLLVTVDITTGVYAEGTEATGARVTYRADELATHPVAALVPELADRATFAATHPRRRAALVDRAHSYAAKFLAEHRHLVTLPELGDDELSRAFAACVRPPARELYPAIRAAIREQDGPEAARERAFAVLSHAVNGTHLDNGAGVQRLRDALGRLAVAGQVTDPAAVSRLLAAGLIDTSDTLRPVKPYPKGTIRGFLTPEGEETVEALGVNAWSKHTTRASYEWRQDAAARAGLGARGPVRVHG